MNILYNTARLTKTVLLLLCLNVLCLASYAQNVTAKATLESSNILLGDQIKLILEVTYPQGTNVSFPSIEKMITPNVELIQKGNMEISNASGNMVRSIESVIVTSFDSGSHVIPPFVFRYSVGGRTDFVKTNALSINVKSFKIDESKGPADIKSPYGAPLTLKEILPYILGFILIAAIIFFLIYAIPRRKKVLPFLFGEEKPTEPPHVIALRELDKIKEKKPWEKGRIKEFYTDISDIMRNYIVQRYQIPALEQTTKETIKEFKRRGNIIDGKSLEQLNQILALADLVKFAKHSPVIDDHTLTLANAYFFILHTEIDEVKEPERPVDDREGEDVEVH